MYFIHGASVCVCACVDDLSTKRSIMCVHTHSNSIIDCDVPGPTIIIIFFLFFVIPMQLALVEECVHYIYPAADNVNMVCTIFFLLPRMQTAT